MEKTKRRIETLENCLNLNSKTPVVNIVVKYVSPTWGEDDDETRKQRERPNASTAVGQS